MKQLWLLLFILPVILWTSCETETLPSESPQSLAENILSRSNGIESLPEGSKILLNARGGVTIEEKIFTYTKGSWSNDNEYQWENANETTYITALHPHDINDPYEENALKDILIAQDTLSQGETDITLTFKHLFASFTLNVEESLIDDIAEIKLTSPKFIERVSFSTGEITLSDNPNTTTLEGNGNNSYEFIIPPMEASLSLSITLNSGTSKQYTLKNHIFKSGFKYECTLKNGEEIPGISNPEEFIAFSQLINKQSYKGYSLNDFGEKQKDGTMLYRLLADIDFSGINISKLLPIGYYNGPSVIFSDIFDGQGFTIYNLTLPDKSINNKVDKNYSGLFGHIGPNGIVKNLHIVKANTVKSTTCTYIGGIAAKNEGIIQNCSVENSKLHYSNSSSTETGIRIGGICASMSNGYIINCHTTCDTIMSSNSGAVGGIIGDSYGNILNSYTYNNIFSVPDGAYAGGIIGSVSITNVLNLANCYVMHTKTMSRWGAIIELLQKNTITLDNLFYNGGNLIYDNKPSTTLDLYKYQYNQFCYEEKHISIYLNEWITTKGITQYPNFDFNNWIRSEVTPFPALFNP